MQNWQTACIKKITWSNNYIFINSMFTCPFQLSPWVATIISTMICRHQLIWCALTMTQLHWGCHNRIKERLVTCLSSHKLSLMDLKCREKKTTAKKHIQYCEGGGMGGIFLDTCSNKYIFQVVSNLLRLPFNHSRDKRTNPIQMILKGPEPDPNPTLFTTFNFLVK